MLRVKREQAKNAKKALKLRVSLLLMARRQVVPQSSRVLDLVSRSTCTAYDCELVALAEQLNIPLVTVDGLLLKSFPNLAISISDFTTR